MSEHEYNRLKQMADQLRRACQQLRAAALRAETTLAEVDEELRQIRTQYASFKVYK